MFSLKGWLSFIVRHECRASTLFEKIRYLFFPEKIERVGTFSGNSDMVGGVSEI